MRTWASLALWAAVALAGCSARSVADGEGSTTEGGIGPGLTDDDGEGGEDGDWEGEKLDVMGEPPPDPPSYPWCLGDHECPSGEAWGFANECGETCLCEIGCETDADCPLPETGTVSPRCDGHCVLPCGQGVRCPGYMYCYPENGQCMWGTYNPGECDPEGGDFDQICARYCTTEASCIPECLCEGGMCPCDSDERQLECADTCPEWVEGLAAQSEPCSAWLQSWLWCITSASCAEVETFFTKYPDGLENQDVCADEYFEVATWCTDFTPLTEYDFPP